jgi:hypothetical protein
MSKEFSILEILGVISGYLLTEKFDRLHELIEWILGGAVFTHQIPSIANIAKTKMIEQFPQFDLSKDHSLNADIETLAKYLRSKDKIAASVLIEGLQVRYGKTFLVKEGTK